MSYVPRQFAEPSRVRLAATRVTILNATRSEEVTAPDFLFGDCVEATS